MCVKKNSGGNTGTNILGIQRLSIRDSADVVIRDAQPPCVRRFRAGVSFLVLNMQRASTSVL